MTSKRKLRTPSPLAVNRAMNTLLEGAYWPQTLSAKEAYSRRHDDTDGKLDSSQDLTVIIGPDSDVHVSTGMGDFLRFRTYFGGGLSPRVRNGLLVLAEAIRRDNEDSPQRPHAPAADRG